MQLCIQFIKLVFAVYDIQNSLTACTVFGLIIMLFNKASVNFILATLVIQFNQVNNR